MANDGVGYLCKRCTRAVTGMLMRCVRLSLATVRKLVLQTGEVAMQGCLRSRMVQNIRFLEVVHATFTIRSRYTRTYIHTYGWVGIDLSSDSRKVCVHMSQSRPGQARMSTYLCCNSGVILFMHTFAQTSERPRHPQLAMGSRSDQRVRRRRTSRRRDRRQ